MRKGSFDQRSLGHFLILRNQLRTQRLDFSSGPLLERVGPWRLGLCQPMIDVVLGAGVFEGVRPDEFSSLRGGPEVRRRRARIAWGGEASSVVGEDGMDLVRDGGDPGSPPRRGARIGRSQQQRKGVQVIARRLSLTRNLDFFFDNKRGRHRFGGNEQNKDIAWANLLLNFLFPDCTALHFGGRPT